jgi:hypothetical protein
MAEGEAKGLAEGEAKGEARGLVKAVLRLLDARGVHVDDASRQRIQGCMDVATLERWLDRALSATRLAEVLDSPVQDDRVQVHCMVGGIRVVVEDLGRGDDAEHHHEHRAQQCATRPVQLEEGQARPGDEDICQ